MSHTPAHPAPQRYLASDWPKVLPKIQAGDYVLLVFGINDGTTLNGTGRSRPGRGGGSAHLWLEHVQNGRRRSGQGSVFYFLTVTARNMDESKVTFKDAYADGCASAIMMRRRTASGGTGGGKYTQWTKDMGKETRIFPCST